jgi:hypothetical protein
MIIVFLALGWTPYLARSTGESYVIGRINGTFQKFPGYFYNNPDVLSRWIDEVEFVGFRLVRSEDSKTYLIRPNQRGYFNQGLPNGEYSLTRKRTDRPGYKEPKTIDILRFTVEPGTLVNLGTINIILDGDPLESLLWLTDRVRGKYTYRYSYEREPGERAFENPYNWFMEKNTKTAAGFGDRVSVVDTGPTLEKDGSKVVLRIDARFFNK